LASRRSSRSINHDANRCVRVDFSIGLSSMIIHLAVLLSPIEEHLPPR